MKKSYRYRRLRYPKQKWSINTVQLNLGTIGVDANNYVVNSVSVIENPPRNNNAGQSVSSASSILKCSHIKIKGVIKSGMIAGQSALIALMYIPEAINPNLNATSTDYIGNSIFHIHPEWLMGWTRMDYSDASQKNEFSLTSRLKRNLNPGDSIKLVLYNINTSTATASVVSVTATSSYCCRAN